MATKTGTSPKKLKMQFPNSLSDVERIQGLAIQPFISALTACQNDIQTQLTYNHIHDPVRCQRDRAAAMTFDRTLMDAGYSNRGTPYWVDRTKGEPTLHQIDAIRNAAEDCKDMLADRYQVLAHATSSKKEVQEFGDRFNTFAEAIDELGFLIESKKMETLHRTVTGRNYMCALE